MIESQPQPIGAPIAGALPASGGLVVGVDRVAYLPTLPAPVDRPFPFGYAITIRNQSPQALTIKARKWVVKDLARGTSHVTEGDGVVGQCPRLEPGEAFSYESFHVVAADSVAEGAYLAFDDAGRSLVVRVPAFLMKVARGGSGAAEI